MTTPRMVLEGHLGGYIDGGDEGTWYPELWDWAIARWGARSVMDIGCGQGHSSKYFLERGCAVRGLDGSRQAIAQSVIPGQAVLHDFCEGPRLEPGTWDLVWSCEFLEHVERRYLPHLLATFAQAGRAILVTHALPGQDGHHHVNCQAPWYWIEWLERLGFRCSVAATIQARKLALSDYQGKKFFAESGLVFVRTAAAGPALTVTAVEAARHSGGELAASWQRSAHRRARLKAWAIDTGLRGSMTYRLWKVRRRIRHRAQKRAQQSGARRAA